MEFGVSLNGFGDYGDEVSALVSKKPDGWEYLLSVALMKFVLRQPLRRWRELQAGVLTAPRTVLLPEEVLPWVQVRLKELQDITQSFTQLYSKELRSAWGAPGVEGDPFEIRDTILSIARTCERCVDWETQVKFTGAPDLYGGLLDAFGGVAAYNLPKLMEAAEIMDAGLKVWQNNPDEPQSISHTVVFEVPPEWNDRLEAELSIISDELGI